MKKLILAAFAFAAFSSVAHAEDPAYTSDKSAWWVSAIFAAPVIGLDAIGRSIELSGKGHGVFDPLHSSTKGIVKHAALGACGAAVVVDPCK